MCLSKKKGGLGVKCLSILNKAFFCKWNWHFVNERETLWNQVIRENYEKDRRGWCSWEVREAHSVGLWKGIRMDWCGPAFFMYAPTRSARFAFICEKLVFWKNMSLKNPSLGPGIKLLIGKVPLGSSTPLSPTKVFTDYIEGNVAIK